MVNVFIKTYGCTANQDNGAIMSGYVVKAGNRLVNSFEDADIVIINTCTVKGVTENKILSEIRFLKEKFPLKKIIVAGCMAGAQESMLKKEFPEFSFVSTQNVTKICKVINEVLNGKIISLTAKNKEVKVGLPKLIKGKTTAVQISEGCADCCYFCITKLAKGHIFSFPMDKIIKEIKKRVGEGCNLIYLTSQDNGAYGLDTEKNSKLAELLNNITNIEGDFKVRVGMMNPSHIIPILDNLIDIFKNPKIMKFVHIPVQSGSNKVLREMNRKYEVGDFKKTIKKFRKDIPGIAISTDIIVGYPTETKKDFEETVNLVREMRFDILNLSKFASRPGTIASKMKKIPTQEIKRRSVIIAGIIKEQKKENIKNNLFYTN